MKLCFLCSSSDGFVNIFDKEGLEKCTRMSLFRKMKKHKYWEIEVPKTISNIGYHAACYQKFTVLKGRYKAEFNSIVSGEIQPAAEQINVEQPEADPINVDQPQPEHVNIESSESEHVNVKQSEAESSDVEEDSETESEEVPINLEATDTSPDVQQLQCIFCDRRLRRSASKLMTTSICSNKEIVQKTKEQAATIGDIHLINKLKDRDFYHYHGTCKIKFRRAYSTCIQKTSEGNWHKLRKYHKEALTALMEFLDAEVFRNENVFLMHDLLVRYKSLLLEVTSEYSLKDFKHYTVANLEEKLRKNYGNTIVIRSSEIYNHKKIIHKRGLDVETVIFNSALQKNSEKCKFQSVAYDLRNSVKSIKKKTYAAVEEDQLIPPGIKKCEELCTNVAYDNYDRFVDTISGKDTLHDTVGIIYQFVPMNENNETESIVLSTDDQLNLSTSAQSQPSTSAQSQPSTSSQLVPSTHSPTDSPESNNSASSDGENNIPRKRRRFDLMPRDITPYVNKPKALTTLIPYSQLSNFINSCNDSIQNSKIKNLIWAFSVSLMSNCPMWIGYNSKTTVDNSSVQVVDYLAQINESPTSYKIVHETMKNAQKIALECKQNEIIVSYDLAIAKMAMQLQLEEQPRFNNLFVNLGAFHIQMAFFKALGKFIDSSGIVDILVQAEVLAEGSINGFIDGKHFSRCKRIHGLLFGALQGLHIEKFIYEYNLDINTLVDE